MIQELNRLNAANLPVPLLETIIALMLAFSLSLMVRFVYHKGRGIHGHDPHFDSVIMFLAPVLSIIMMLIGSNLALSIGMVGSLSIIRFRNVIKSSRDMVFLFWLIAIGLGCGTFSYRLTLISSAIIAVFLFLHQFKQDKELGKCRQLTLRGQGKIPLSSINAVLAQAGGHKLIHWQEHAEGWDFMTEITNLSMEDKFLEELRALNPSHLAFHNVD
jgi:hypothetical protein